MQVLQTETTDSVYTEKAWGIHLALLLLTCQSEGACAVMVSDNVTVGLYLQGEFTSMA